MLTTRIRDEKYRGGKNPKICKENEGSGYEEKPVANSNALRTLASESDKAIKGSVMSLDECA